MRKNVEHVVEAVLHRFVMQVYTHVGSVLTVPHVAVAVAVTSGEQEREDVIPATNNTITHKT